MVEVVCLMLVQKFSAPICVAAYTASIMNRTFHAMCSVTMIMLMKRMI